MKVGFYLIMYVNKIARLKNDTVAGGRLAAAAAAAAAATAAARDAPAAPDASARDDAPSTRVGRGPAAARLRRPADIAAGNDTILSSIEYTFIVTQF